ncbi:hypothetical protein ElyMa_006441700 [Elysia marginata]|uniref:Uncharacterized protein n=1 Tax=Elysia marginata TaxID=1093978 RepID=A0AAV4HYK6_9GAST|nr:hypothetical protein ElyMa_006441700 [Elysia marginata]
MPNHDGEKEDIKQRVLKGYSFTFKNLDIFIRVHENEHQRPSKFNTNIGYQYRIHPRCKIFDDKGSGVRGIVRFRKVMRKRLTMFPIQANTARGRVTSSVPVTLAKELLFRMGEGGGWVGEWGIAKIGY